MTLEDHIARVTERSNKRFAEAEEYRARKVELIRKWYGEQTCSICDGPDPDSSNGVTFFHQDCGAKR